MQINSWIFLFIWQFKKFNSINNFIDTLILSNVFRVIANRTYEFDLQEEYANYSNSKVYTLNSRHYTKVYDTTMFINLDTCCEYCLCLTVQYYIITLERIQHCYKVCLNWWLNEKPIRCILQLRNYVVWVFFSL